jgi:translocation and assembly module TamB
MLRSVLKLAGAGIVVLLLLLALAFGAAQTGPGKAWVAARLGSLLSDPAETVTFDGLGGFIPFAPHVEKITVADAAGPRLIIKDAALDIAPAALLRGRLTIRDLTARAVTFERSGGGTTDLAALLNPPLPITLQHLEIDTLNLGPAVLGTEMNLAVEGNGALGGGKVGLNLMVARRDAPGHAGLHLAYGGTPERLYLAANVAEPSGTVLARLLHAKAPVPLSIDLNGDGPLADWHGHLHAAAGKAMLGASFRIVGDGEYRLTVDGNAEPAPLLPAEWQALLGPHVSFSAGARFGADDHFTLDRLALSTSAATVTAQGRYAGEDHGIAGTLTLTASELAKLEPLLHQRIAGAGTAKLAVSGKLARPVIEATIALKAPRVAGAGAEEATAALEITPQGDPWDAATPIDLAGHGQLLGVTAPQPLPGGFGAAIDWRLSARLDRASERLQLHDLVVVDKGATLSLAGDATRGGMTGRARLALPDLAPLTAGRLGGALDATADLTAAADGSATAVLSGAIDRPRAGEARLDALLGARLDINGTLRRATDGTLAASDVTVAGAGLHLAGDGQRRADGRLVTDYRLDLPRLAALDPGLGGSAHAKGHLEGPPDALSGTTTVQGTALAAGTTHIDKLDATLAIADLAELRGSLAGTFRTGGLSGSLSAQTALTSDRILRVPQFSLTAAGAQLGGAASVNLASAAVTGEVKGRIPDLRPWSTLAGAPLAGSIGLTGSLKGETLDLVATGTDISWGAPTASAQSLRLTASLSDVFNRPKGHAELTLTGGAAGTAKLARLHLKGMAAKPGLFDVTAEAVGAAGAPFRIGAAASALVAKGGVDLRVTQLSGTLAGAPVKLGKPLSIAWHGGAGSFADLALRLGAGRLDGEGKIAGGTLSLHLLGAHLPVATFARLGGRENFDGDLGFELTLSGSRAAPQGHIVVDAEELHLAAASAPDLPALGIVASATWRQDTVQFRGRIAGPHDAALGFSGSAPLVLDSERLALHLPQSGALALHLEGGGDLANLLDLLPLGENRLAGRFAVDVTVGGTVGDPLASGRLTVSGARYENLASGTVLSGMNFTVLGDRDRLVLRGFTANDGGAGLLVLRGAVDLAATPGPALDLSAALTRFRAIQLDEATVTASGELRLSGTLAAPRLAAELTIDEADINMPGRLPQSVRPVPVTRIDSATGRTLSTPKSEPASSPLLALSLEVRVRAPGPVFVRGRGLDSVWRGALTATGSTAAPQLTGKLELVRGTYDFLGKSFILSRGTIAFLGDPKIDPTLDIEARSTSSDVTAIVQLGGTMSEPTVTLSSEPQLPQDEILARVLFGTSISQIGPAQGLQLAEAAASLASGADLSVLGKIRRGLGLDRLSIGSQQNQTVPGLGVPALTGQPGVPGSGPAVGLGTTPLPPGAAGSPAGVAGTAVSAGKYVANGVYVGVSQGFTPGSSTVNAQIDVSRHISIDTQASQAGGSGVGINWKLDY